MAGPRRYDDPCGIARALDVIGDRWALLVVRELLFGPKRFGQLRDGLHGVSPNVLAQRLRELEDAGVVQRDVLAPPADVAVYELTDRGRDLEPVLLALGGWGSREPVRTERELSPDAFLVALKTVFVGGATTATFALCVDGQWVSVVARADSLEIARGRPATADATISGGVAALRSFAFGRTTLAAAERSRQLNVEGSRRAAARFPRLFRAPAASRAAIG